MDEKLPAFGKPVLLAWAPEDRLFPLKHAERLRDRFHDARLVEFPDSHAFAPEDNPERLVEAVSGLLRWTGADFFL